MHAQADYALAALSIERFSEKDPKRYSSYKDIADNILFFFDEEWEILQTTKPSLPEVLTVDIVRSFVARYCEVLDLSVDVQSWFEQLKTV